MEKTFRPWDVDQAWLFPPSVRDLVPEGHIAHFIRDLVRDELDLSPILETYREARGFPPYHPAMMTALLLYGYSQGIYSSRRIERSCEQRVDFMAVAAMAKPDHSTISEFRRRHLTALSDLFVQVLRLCQEADLVTLGHVSLDGTKVKANASKHKASSYGRMLQTEERLAREIRSWLEKAEAIDKAEDEEYGPDRRGDETSPWMKTKKERLAKIREAKARLEAKAKEKAKRVAEERAGKEKERGRSLGGPLPKALDGEPDEKSQMNFTDPESRIMKTRDGYEQAYNAQASVDAEHQIIVSQDVVAKQNDVDELIPALDQIEANLGVPPTELSADTGYCSEANLDELESRGIRGYVATGRQKHGAASPTSIERAPQGPRSRAMRKRLRQGGWRSRYRLRKQTVEPVFGQIKEARGFRRFLMRGLEKVQGEWSMLCTAHNLLKLHMALSAT